MSTFLKIARKLFWIILLLPLQSPLSIAWVVRRTQNRSASAGRHAGIAYRDPNADLRRVHLAEYLN